MASGNQLTTGVPSKLKIEDEPPETQQFLKWRHAMMKYAEAVKNDRPPPNNCSDSDVRKILDRLAISSYDSYAWKRSKIEKCFSAVHDEAKNKYPPTAAMAKELADRLKDKNATPGPLQTSVHEDEIEDSGMEEDEDEDEEEDEVDGSQAGSEIMANLERSGISWKISDPSKKRDFRVFGHNDIELGQWWPLQLCALRDGAHGSRMGGISGTATDGCYSIVVAGGKSTAQGHDEYKDVDNFETLWYSGTVSSDKTPENAAVPPITTVTKALIASGNSYKRHGKNTKGVRVIRAKGASKYAPPVGLRYDGLYWVTDYELVGNANNGYYRFFLERKPGQLGYEELKKRPNAYERNWYDNRDQTTR